MLHRKGSGYYLGLTLADKTGKVEARVWEEAEEINSYCQIGAVVEVAGRVRTLDRNVFSG